MDLKQLPSVIEEDELMDYESDNGACCTPNSEVEQALLAASPLAPPEERSDPVVNVGIQTVESSVQTDLVTTNEKSVQTSPVMGKREFVDSRSATRGIPLRRPISRRPLNLRMINRPVPNSRPSSSSPRHGLTIRPTDLHRVVDETGNKTPVCFVCKKIGHVAKYCRHRSDQN